MGAGEQENHMGGGIEWNIQRRAWSIDCTSGEKVSKLQHFVAGPTRKNRIAKSKASGTTRKCLLFNYARIHCSDISCNSKLSFSVDV